MRIYYKDDSRVIEDLGTGFSGRIKVSHSQEGMMGNSILTINAVRITDAQDFICQVKMDGGSEERHTQLKVFSKINPSCRSGTTWLSIALANFYTKSNTVNVI